MSRRFFVELTCEDAPALLETLRARGIRPRDVDIAQGNLSFVCDGREAERIRRICASMGAECLFLPRSSAAGRVASRAGAVFAALLLAVGAAVSQLYVTDIEIEGADGQAQSQIVALLAENGISGTLPKSGIDTDEIAELIERNVEGVALVEAGFKGNRLVVGVVDTDIVAPGHETDGKLISDCYAIVTRVVVFDGTAAVKEGDIVKPGDVLIDDRINVGTEEEPQWVQTGADGEVYARVYETQRLLFSRSYTEYVPTGRTHTAISVSVGGRTVFSVGADHGFELYEADTSVTVLRGILPVSITRTVYRETEATKRDTDATYIRSEIDAVRADMMSDVQGVVLSEGVNTGKYGDIDYAEIYIETERRIDRREA